jgi:hypothetical protein
VWLKVVTAVAAGAIAGLVAGYAGVFPAPWAIRSGLSPEEFPLPHQVPKYAGGTALRLAMVHDVLHERYPRHGPDYYRARNAAARKGWEEHQARHRQDELPDAHTLSLLDDLGVGLDQVGEHAEAVEVLRDKLRRQQAAGLKGRALYTSFANLGTVLIHGNFRAAQSGSAAAQARLREGLDFVRQSIEVNPEAHFGREVWQAIAVEYFLTVCEKPDLLLRFDLIGDDLSRALDPAENRCERPEGLMIGVNRDIGDWLRTPPNQDTRDDIRKYITAVGAEEHWDTVVPKAQKVPAPFDEPTLGIVGMWRYGGGPNPHFALALGEIMMRVGQRYIAWSAYERAIEMKDRFWPDPAICAQLVEHCRRRQAVIESQLDPGERDSLRPRFQAELAYGRGYQKDYQGYEARRVADGASVDDPHFYDEFNAHHEAIASPVGKADAILIKQGSGGGIRNPIPAMVFGAGLFAFLAATFLGRWRPPRVSLPPMQVLPRTAPRGDEITRPDPT